MSSTLGKFPETTQLDLAVTGMGVESPEGVFIRTGAEMKRTAAAAAAAAAGGAEEEEQPQPAGKQALRPLRACMHRLCFYVAWVLAECGQLRLCARGDGSSSRKLAWLLAACWQAPKLLCTPHKGSKRAEAALPLPFPSLTLISRPKQQPCHTVLHPLTLKLIPSACPPAPLPTSRCSRSRSAGATRRQGCKAGRAGPQGQLHSEASRWER